MRHGIRERCYIIHVENHKNNIFKFNRFLMVTKINFRVLASDVINNYYYLLTSLGYT